MTLLGGKQGMTIEQFLAFNETRPDEERWELIDGEPILTPSASDNHQRIVVNLALALGSLEREDGAWEVLPGFGVRLSPTSLPVPDVLLRPRQHLSGYFCDDMIVAFEVLSLSTKSRDLDWKKRAYEALPSLRHYVVLHEEEIAIQCFDRANGWTERRLGPEAVSLALPDVSVNVPVRALYDGTGL